MDIFDANNCRKRLEQGCWRHLRATVVLAFFAACPASGVADANAQDSEASWIDETKDANSKATIYLSCDGIYNNGTKDTFTGTGFVVDPRGYVLTCSHVVPKKSKYSRVEIQAGIGTNAGPFQKLYFVARDEDLDLALLQFHKASWSSVKPVKLDCDWGEIRTGAEIVALGFPEKMDLLPASGRITDPYAEDGRLITDQQLNHGMSGGPVFNSDGKVIAIVAASHEELNAVKELIPLRLARNLLQLHGICSSSSSPIPTQLAATKTSVPSGWPLAGEETFTTESPGWKFGSFSTTEEPRFDLRIVDGKYRWDLEYNLGWRDLVFAPYATAVSFYGAVDAKFTNFTALSTVSLAFGAIGNQRYDFTVSSAGYFNLIKFTSVTKGQATPLIDWSLITFKSGQKFDPKAWNRLTVVVDESLIRCYVNSELQGETRDSAFAGGQLGFGVGMNQAGAAVVDFDNFEFRRKP